MTAAGTPDSPSMPESLARMSRHLGPARSHGGVGSPVGRLSVASTPGGRSNPADRSDSDNGPNLFQLPQFYWNHLTTGPTDPAPEQNWEWDVEQWHSNVPQENLPPQQYLTPEYNTFTGGTTQRYDMPQPWDQPGQAYMPQPGPSGPPGGPPGPSQSYNRPNMPGPSGSSGPLPTPPMHSQGPRNSHGNVPPPPMNGGQGSGTPGTGGSQADQAAIYAALMSYMVQAAKT